MILYVRAMFHAMFHAFIKMCIIQSFCMSCSFTTIGIWLLSFSTLYVCFTYILIMTCPSFSSVSKYYNEAPQLQNQYIQARTQRFKRGFLVLPSRQSKMWGSVGWAHRLWQNCGIFQHSKYAWMMVSANNGTHNHTTTPKMNGHNITYNYRLFSR